MSWLMKWGLHGYSNLVLFYPFLRAPGNIHSNTKKWRQNQKHGYEQDQQNKTTLAFQNNILCFLAKHSENISKYICI